MAGATAGGVPILALEEVDSTNAEAARRAAAGEPGPLWILARRQSAGRGRRGRSWLSAEGNLAATLLLRPRLDARSAALLGLAMALALAETLDALAGRPNAAEVKWPNDVLVAGRKVAGILTESAGTGARLDWLAIGVGVNLVSAPPREALDADAQPPGAVAELLGLRVAPRAFLEALAARFAHWQGRIEAGEREALRRALVARLAGRGAPVGLRLGDGRRREAGVIRDIAADGALVVETPEGRRSLHAAEVILEPAGQGG